MGRRSTGPKLPREFANDLRRQTRGFKGAATFSRRVGYDAKAMRKLRTVAAENNALNWRTGGSAMGNSWRGAKAGATILNDAVYSGTLKEHASTPWLLKPRVSAKAIFFNVPKRRVPHVKYLGKSVFGWTLQGKSDLVATMLAEMVAIAERKREP